jgi:hypothetical protein
MFFRLLYLDHLVLTCLPDDGCKKYRFLDLNKQFVNITVCMTYCTWSKWVDSMHFHQQRGPSDSPPPLGPLIWQPGPAARPSSWDQTREVENLSDYCFNDGNQCQPPGPQPDFKLWKMRICRTLALTMATKASRQALNLNSNFVSWEFVVLLL